MAKTCRVVKQQRWLVKGANAGPSGHCQNMATAMDAALPPHVVQEPGHATST